MTPFGDAGVAPDDKNVQAGKLTRLDVPRLPGQLTISAGGGTPNTRRGRPQSRISKGGGQLGVRTDGQKTTKNQTTRKKKQKKQKQSNEEKRRGDRMQGCDNSIRDWDLGPSPAPHNLAPVGKDSRICRQQRAKIGEEREEHPAAHHK